MWKQEKEMLDMLKHRNIVDLKAFDGRQFAIYLEALPLSLSRGTKSPFSQSDAYTILRDVSSAFEYMSSLSIIHNDIKPHNIAYSPQRGPVLIDFGMATLDQDKPAGGTPWYLPPDMLYGNRRGFAGDVWALGITMLYILGKIDLPERGKDGWSLENLTEEDDPSRKKMKAWLEFIALKKSQLNQENTLESIVFRMLDWNGESRITAESILTELDFLEFDSGNDGESSDGSK
ncbi:hypothetical protein TrVFT333_007436 [Trichoderma virens FT-333]|nr:hypothetical protein TrVFT333_007436 [Trichoderma virens FT-333]